VAQRWIGDAIEHPGALNRDVGGPAHEHLDKVRWLAEHGTTEQKRRANLYLKQLRPADLKRRRRRKGKAKR
jgi:hypothetical protein